jgi:hypothetical protein
VWSPERPRWHVGMSTHQLVRTLHRGGRPGREIECDSVRCQPGAQDAPWQAAVAALGLWLAQARTRPPVVQIILSGGLLRWQLLPWRSELVGPQEVAAYAKLRFAETFGPLADTWQILHAPQPPGCPMPACAVDAALLQALRAVCQGAGARLHTVVPYFSSAADFWRAKLGRGSTWFGLIEPDWISLGLLHQGTWQALRGQRLDGDWRSALPGLMARVTLSAGERSMPARTFLAGACATPDGIHALPFEWLRPSGAAGSGVDARRLALGI